MDRNVLIVGASGGIGHALADAHEAAGWRVERASRATGLDLLDEASIAALAERIATPDRVIVATGVLHDGHQPERSMKALDPEHLIRDYRINAIGPALVAKHLIPRMARDRPVVFAALSARVGSISDNRLGGWHAYRASKAALNMLIRTVAIEAARTHPQLIVCGLHPGTVVTDLSAPFQKGVPAERLFSPEQAAEQLMTVIDGLTPAQSGGVFAWDGAAIPA
ncbi:SDR family NAD(P)-dependent oxidoreductase [Brevundimonas sp.]|uniref:SDR family NAD(P)-dependent oxidoreductase n=1 Tax=Brevundimonas sp. TaxID=1871086 RepID=UPI0035B3EF96